MWVSAFFGMATIYGEAVLAQEYKTTVDGEVTGGPVYYIRQAFKGTFGKILAVVFAVFIILALGFMGNMVQSNSIGAAFGPVSYTHLYAIAKAFLEAGIHVACDKPLVTTVQEAEDLKKTADEKDLLFMVTYTYTGHVTMKYMRDLVKNGEIGTIRTVMAEYPPVSYTHLDQGILRQTMELMSLPGIE